MLALLKYLLSAGIWCVWLGCLIWFLQEKNSLPNLWVKVTFHGFQPMVSLGIFLWQMCVGT
jgi:hypothetical protein